jgi:pilus assembly protein CpaE
MSETCVSVRLELKNEATRKELEESIASVKGFVFETSHKDSSPCDLLILETGADVQKDFQFIQSLQASGKAKEIFLTSPHLEPDLLLQALRAGIKEFFGQPIQREEVRNGLLKYRERKEGLKQGGGEKKKGKIINIIGSKGGVGTTTIAVNVATSLCDFNGSPSVALIDMNLFFGQIPVFLNIESSFNWGEVVRNITRVDATYLMSILSKHHSGVHVLPAPSTLDDVYEATPEIIERLLGFMRNVFDFILIDGGQRLDDVSLKILEMSDTVLLVAVLDLPCLTNAKRLLWTFQKLGFPPKEAVRMIVNRYQKKSAISLKEAEQAVGEEIRWLLPNDSPVTMSAINQGKPISEVGAASELSRSLRELAGSFFPGEHKKRKWFGQ